ncbi:MAG: tyrosine-type recombinase/integrase [Pseudomonadota bacterium]
MSIYFVKDKGWRYDFTLNGIRQTEAWFETKKEAKLAEARRKEELNNPQPIQTQTDMAFSDLLNNRMDYVKAYNSELHYTQLRYIARRWNGEWGELNCSEITPEIIERYLLKLSKKVAPITVNADLKNLRAFFNFGIKKKLITLNPTKDIEFLPVDKKVKYVPPIADVLKVILAADKDAQDYICSIKETLARKNEISMLKWSDVNLVEKYVVLYTRKKKGGHLTPRKVPMTEKLHAILLTRYKNRDADKSWVFWHHFWSRKQKVWIDGPYKDRKKLMKNLCKKAGVKHFGFHALRHFGASILDNANVNLGTIQRILGHEKRTTTEIYLHSMGESERDAMKLFEQIQSAI